MLQIPRRNCTRLLGLLMAQILRMTIRTLNQRSKVMVWFLMKNWKIIMIQKRMKIPPLISQKSLMKMKQALILRDGKYMTREQIEADIKRIKDANAEDEGLCKAFLPWRLQTAEPGLHIVMKYSQTKHSVYPFLNYRFFLWCLTHCTCSAGLLRAP